MSDGKTRNLAVPFFTQRDNTYVWQKQIKEELYSKVVDELI